MKKSSDQTGFTLIELLITIAIAAIMLAMAAPSLQEIYNNNMLSTYSSDFRMTLYRAQNEAVKRNRRVTVQAKSAVNQVWQGGWDIYIDSNNNNTIDSTEEVLYSYVPSAENYRLTSKNVSFGNAVSFAPSGSPIGNAGSTDGEFWLCRPDNNATLSRTIKIGFSGFISVVEGATCS